MKKKVKKNLKNVFLVVVCFFAVFSILWALVFLKNKKLLQTSVGTSEKSSICAIGDSLTAEYQVKLAELLGPNWGIINKGIGGNTTSQMLERFNEDVLTYQPDFVIIWGGINDVGAGFGAKIIEHNLQQMYTLAHNGIKVISINITPFKGSFYDTTEDRQKIVDEVNTWIASEAINVDYRLDMFSLLEDVDKKDYLLAIYDYGDHLHLNLSGQYFVGETVYKRV